MGELFGALERGLASVLAFFYDVWPSFGGAIILLTILINVILFPLTLKQTRSTRAFQAIQPDIKRLQKEYKEQPEKLQAEMMKLQKESGATPGGCLVPLLVQMPIWFALFRVLREPLNYLPAESALAGVVRADAASFLGLQLGLSPGSAFSELGIGGAWGYLLLIGLMVATQYVQQVHAMPKTDGPKQPAQQSQQLVTRIMPLFIGVISWQFPTGLIVYWATSNLFRLGQQVVIFRIDGRPPAMGQEPTKPKPAPDPEAKPPKPQGSAKKRSRRRRK